jgi:acyl carrier protein
MDNLFELQEVFREVFGDDTIALKNSTTADDVAGWDSLMHINLIVAIEERFKVKFATAEIARLKGDDQNVGTLLEVISAKVRSRLN